MQDVSLLSNPVDQLEDTLIIYREESAKLGLQGSRAKTQLMHIGDDPDSLPFHIGPDGAEFISSFIFLAPQSPTTETRSQRSAADWSLAGRFMFSFIEVPLAPLFYLQRRRSSASTTHRSFPFSSTKLKLGPSRRTWQKLLSAFITDPREPSRTSGGTITLPTNSEQALCTSTANHNNSLQRPL